MSIRDPLQCKFDDASRTTLLAGIALDTSAKVNFFEEMVSLAHQFGAYDRLALRDEDAIDDGQRFTDGASTKGSALRSGSGRL